MNDLDSEIRRVVFEWAEQAPVAPTLDHLTSPTGSAAAPRPPGSRRVFVAAVVVAAVALIAGVVAVSTHRQDSTVVQAGITPARATLADVAGRTSGSRMGFPAAPAGFSLDYEFTRDQALAADGSTLPTGPLGPVYAQYLRPLDVPDTYTVPAAQTDGTLPDPAGWSVGVVTVLPVEQGDVVLAAAGHSDGKAVTINGHDGVAVAAWSAADDNVVSWTQDGVAVVVVGTAITPLAQIEQLAAQVRPVDHTPVLEPIGPTIDQLNSASVAGSWSLAPGASTMVGRDAGGATLTGWSILRSAGPLWNAFSTVVDHENGPGGRFTVRAAGSPSASSTMEPMTVPRDATTGQPIWPDTMMVGLAVADGAPDVVDGFAPVDVREVRVVLSDGQTLQAPTYDLGRGWPVLIFAVAAPDIHDDQTATGLHVVRIDGFGVGGAVLFSGPSAIGNAPGDVNAGSESPPRCPANPESCAAAEG